MCEVVTLDDEPLDLIPAFFSALDQLIEKIQNFLLAFHHWFVTFADFTWDTRSYLERLVHRIDAAIGDIYFVITHQNLPHNHRELSWKSESKGLFVLIHGLSSKPSYWDRYIELIGDEYDLFVPSVPLGGHCSLEEATDPIYDTVKEYALQFPDKKICLIGHSNGGRMVHYIDLKMMEEVPATTLKVVTIASPTAGTYLANLATFFNRSPAYHELSFGSERARALVAEIQKPLPEGVAPREHLRYASKDDPFLHPGSAFVPLYKNETNVLLYGEGHGTLLDYLAPTVVPLCKEFFL